MFKSIKRLMIAATAVLALSWPTAAYAFVQVTDGGQATSVQPRPSIVQGRTAAEQQRLDQLQASGQRRFASEGGWPTGASAVHSTGPSSQAAFRWGDAGIGAAGVLALIGIGAGATLVIRRRVHQPIVG